MVVVMPAGHTTKSLGMGSGVGGMVDEFSEDFVNDVMPYVESNYRVLANRKDRAIANLSMGWIQRLNVAISDLGKFAYIGVFRSGIFGMGGNMKVQSDSPSWEEQHKDMLDNKNLKKGQNYYGLLPAVKISW